MKLFNPKIFYLFLIITGFSIGCANEVDINDDYKEISIAYGLLNSSEDQHFVKFTKAFQTDGNVYIAAGDAANSQYEPDDIEMWFEEFNKNGNYIKTINLDTFMVTNKDTGNFYYPNQLVYATPKGTILNPGSEYRFFAKVLSSGNIIESQTNLVQDFSINIPPTILKYLDFTGNYQSTVEWRSAENGKLYQLVIRYFYTDVPLSGPTTSHYVDWTFSQTRSTTTQGGEKLKYQYTGATFYDILAGSIPPAENGLIRYSDSLYYIFNVADENFTVYMDVNAPSNSIVQERPAFSNISNGLGLFSSRYNKIRFFEGISARSMDSLITGSKTYQLGFKYRP